MPKIFSEEDRVKIRNKLLINGRKILEKKSYNSISIAEIALETGIAKGTFYNFFPSKEEFFYEIMLIIRDDNRKEFYKLMDNPSRDAVADMFYRRYTVTKTVYDYFEPEELKIIFRKLPEKEEESDINSVELAKELIGKCVNSSNVSPGVVVNLMNIAAAAAANREILIKEDFEATIRVVANAIADYIYGGK